MEVKLFDSELKVMEVLWESGDLTAGQLAKQLKDLTGWNRNTTYTVIKKLVDKGAIARSEPGFLCHALISKEQVRQQETTQLIDRFFSGSPELFLATFLSGKQLSQEEVAKLRQIIDDLS